MVGCIHYRYPQLRSRGQSGHHKIIPEPRLGLKIGVHVVGCRPDPEIKVCIGIIVVIVGDASSFDVRQVAIIEVGGKGHTDILKYVDTMRWAAIFGLIFLHHGCLLMLIYGSLAATVTFRLERSFNRPLPSK
jgi:hypothetical protein